MLDKFDHIRLGTSHLIWGFDLSVQPRLEVFFDDAATIGFEGVLCFDTTVMPWLDRAAEFRALLDKRKLAFAGVILRPETDPTKLGAMLDCGHATKDFKKHTAAEYFHRNHARIKHVEFKDWTPETDLNTEVGAGRCDFPAVVKELRKHSYKGWLVVEQNPPQADPKASAQRSFRHITETPFA